jgi:hypothetical protein
MESENYAQIGGQTRKMLDKIDAAGAAAVSFRRLTSGREVICNIG